MHRLLGLHATLECHYLLTVTAPSLPNKSIKTLLKRNAACYRSGLPPDQKSGLRLPHEPPSFKLALTEHNAHLPKAHAFIFSRLRKWSIRRRARRPDGIVFAVSKREKIVHARSRRKFSDITP